MRDEFSADVKDELARRVGFLCSNPGCRQLTSGPQEGPKGTVSIGVAAHITAASPGGPRYDPSITAEDRTSASNGIWVCQSCAKLIDSDVMRYTKDKLIEWKSDNEASAARRVEQRGVVRGDAEGVFLEAERLMPALVREMTTDVRSDETELVREFVILPAATVGYGWPRDHFRYVESEHPGLQNQLRWMEEAGLIEDITPGNMKAYRWVPEFYRWLRVVGIGGK